MINKTLEQLYAEHCGKVTDKWSIYLSEYERLFSDYRDRPIRLLEIGIQNGGSLEIWNKFFPCADRIVGCDINPDCARLQYDDPKVSVVVADVNTDEAQQQILGHSSNFDLIIDDGSHQSGDIIRSFARYFAHLNDGGLYVVEDLHCSYWQEYEGGIFQPYSSIGFFKRLIDIMSHEHWGIEKTRREILHSFTRKYNANFDEATLSHIHSVEFINSICVIRKAQPLINILGHRVIAGTMEFVIPGLLPLHGSGSPLHSQVTNQWTSRDIPVEEELIVRLQQIADLSHEIVERDAQIVSLNQVVAECNAQIVSLNQALLEQEEQIARLIQSVAERDEHIRAILSSRSWRLTKPFRFISRLLQGQGSEVLANLRSHIYRTGKSIYWCIPPKLRQKVLYWSYRNLGILFRGLPHYKNWRNSCAHVQINTYWQHNLLDINQHQPASEAGGSIAIHLHIFYHDLVKEFIEYLKNMPFAYDLYISVASDEGLNVCQRAFAKLPFCRNVNIKRVFNRGRDIAPMFCTYGEELAGYDYVAHLHSKKSLYNKGATEGWRQYLCSNLVGSEECIRRIFSLMQGEQPCGIVYPQNYALLPYMANTWLANRGLGEVWCARLGISDVPRGYFDFPAGSMFWARGDALAPLFKAGIAIDDFAEESGQADGTFAHCLEHLFVLSSLKQGMRPGIIKDHRNPSWSAWRFDQYTNRSYQDKAQLLISTSIKLIAFDIFDTLLCRPLLDPESVKVIVARRIGGETGRLYRDYRAIAERQARDAKGSDVGLDEIYTRLGELTGLDAERLAEARCLEEEVETACLEPRWQGLHLYRDALASGKPVVLITDMFLPRELLEKCLCTHGINGWDAFFVSNEIGLRKDSGKLYEHVFAQYAIEPAEMLMVGDNERSDVQIPGDMGASLLHLLKPVEFARGLPRFSSLIACHESSGNIDAEITLGLVVRKNFASINYPAFDPDSLVQVTPYNLGYSLVGPLLVSFAQWLFQTAREDGVDRLYFLSREGKLIKRVYDYWSEGEKNTLNSDYLVISRRTASVAMISTLDDILGIARATYFSNTIEKFLYERYGLSLSDERWSELTKTLNWERTTVVSVQNRQIEHLVPLLQTLEAEIIDNARNELPPLHRYLTDKGLNLDDRQAVVDVGYGGSIQGYLNRLVPQKVHGYYLMTDERSATVAEMHNVILRGCFFENAGQSSNAPIMYRHSFQLEKLLSADDPQIIHYEIDAAGNVKAHYRELTFAEIECANMRKHLQEGVMEYAKDARQVCKTILAGFQPSCWTAQLLIEAFITQQSKSEAELLSKFVLDDYYYGRGLVY